MSIRIGLYEFFAYTIPGIFYLAIIGFWLNASGVIRTDFTTLNNLSGSFLLVILGAGYIIGILIDFFALRWFWLFHSKTKDAVKVAYEEFMNRHRWVNLDFDPTDWGILLRAVKSKSLEAAADVEQNNVASIMLRNLSLAFFLSSVSCLVYFFVMNSSIWNIVLCMVFVLLAILAMVRSKTRRHWFHLGIFEAFTAHFLLDAKINKRKSVDKARMSTPKPARTKINDGKQF
jgi:hypothetical protein